MKNKRSFGPDGISNKLIKRINLQICAPLAFLINLSLKTSYIPENWKVAKVVPIYKKAGDPNNCTNYRPISLLITYNKILEKIVAKQIWEHLNKNNLIYKHQYGFRAQHETQHALIALLHETMEGKHKKMKTAIIQLDLKKAFDSLNINLLIKKIRAFGLPVEWFHSYHLGRSQFTQIGKAKSSNREIKFGVPQGSVLGPLLFLIYINDLSNVLVHSTPFFFADDTSIVTSGKNNEELEHKLNLDLGLAYEWFCRNGLTVHPQKSVLLQLNGADGIKARLGDHFLEEGGTTVSPAKFLGVYIDKNLTFDKQIEHVRNKIRKGCFILRTCKNTIPIKIKIMVYQALVKPHLDYALAIWGSAGESKLTTIEKLQKGAIRAICNSGYNAHTTKLFSRLNLLKFKDLLNWSKIKLGYKITNYTAPEAIREIFPIKIACTKLRSASEVQLAIPNYKFVSRLPSVSVPMSFNAIPPELKLVRNIKKLKSLYKIESISSYDMECDVKNCWVCNQ